jgi:DNA-binding response OmpR family regulator
MDAKTYNILLVEDNDIDARVITQSFAQAGEGRFSITRATRLNEALERLRADRFDLVLLDFVLPDSEGLSTFSAVQQQAGGVPIVALTGMSDESIGIEAVRLGAQDFLVKGQVQPRELQRAVQYAIERHKVQSAQLKLAQGGKTGKTIGFIGARGGVGTTTAVVNIAAATAQKHKGVVAAELTPFYSAFHDHFFYKKGRSTVNNLETLMKLDREKITQRELEACLVRLPTGLGLLLGSQQVNEFKELDPEKTDAVIQALSASGQYVLLDLPNHVCAANQAAAKHCDFVVVAVDRTPSCVMAGKLMVDLLVSWGVIPVRIGVMVINRQPMPISMDINELLAAVGCPLVGVVPSATDACSGAIRRGAPMVINDPDDPASGALLEIMDKLTAEQTVGR